MNTVSLFNGMSVCQMAMIDAGIDVGTHYISEIDKYANKASEALFSEPLAFIDWCKSYCPCDIDDDCGVINTGELEHAHEDRYESYIRNFTPQIQLGDVTKWQEWDIDWSTIDLVTGGFP